MMKHFLALKLLPSRPFSTLAKAHQKVHSGSLLEPKLFENDFLVSNDTQLEFVRHPFYDLARAEKMEPHKAHELLDEISLKMSYLEGFHSVTQPPQPTPESLAFTRYADNLSEDRSKHVFQIPKGEPFRRISAAELFRVQKTQNHWDTVKRSKSFLTA
jgi:hypothetical protein